MAFLYFILIVFSLGRGQSDSRQGQDRRHSLSREDRRD